MYYIIDNNKIVLANDNIDELTDTQEIMPQYKNYEILETKENETIVDFQLMTLEEAKIYEENKKRDEINLLKLTKREVYLALYDDKGITPDQIKAQIKDPKALIELDYANEYYRGNPIIDKVGEALGYTSDELDYLFMNGKFEDKSANNVTDKGIEL